MIKESKSERLNIRLTPTDKKIIENKAKACDMTMTDYVVAAAITQKIVVLGDKEGLKDVAYELNKIGTSINQLRMLSNFGKINCVGLDEFTDAISDIKDEVTKIVSKKSKWQY